MVRSIYDQEIDDMFIAGYNQLLQKIEEFHHKDSGWVVDYSIALDPGKNFSFISAKYIHLNSRVDSNVTVYYFYPLRTCVCPVTT